MYCAHCGNPLPEAEEIAADAIETAASADVEIAKINAERDIQLAKIQAKVAENTISLEQAEELAAAEAKADALEGVLAPEPEAAPDSPVIVVDASETEVTEDEPSFDLPPAESDSEAQDSKPSKPSYGSPGWFK